MSIWLTCDRCNATFEYNNPTIVEETPITVDQIRKEDPFLCGQCSDRNLPTPNTVISGASLGIIRKFTENRD